MLFILLPLPVAGAAKLDRDSSPFLFYDFDAKIIGYIKNEL